MGEGIILCTRHIASVVLMFCFECQCHLTLAAASNAANLVKLLFISSLNYFHNNMRCHWTRFQLNRIHLFFPWSYIIHGLQWMLRVISTMTMLQVAEIAFQVRTIYATEVFLEYFALLTNVTVHFALTNIPSCSSSYWCGCGGVTTTVLFPLALLLPQYRKGKWGRFTFFQRK